MQTTKLVTVVRESSAECAKWNTEQAELIEAGIALPKQPTDDILKREEAYAKQQELDRKRQEAKKNFLATLSGINPHNVQLALEEMWVGSDRWSSGTMVGYKLVIGSGYGHDANRTWMKVGTDKNPFELTAAQRDKAEAKIADIAKVMLAERAAWNAEQSAEARTTEFIKANPEFCKRAGHSYYNSGETIYIGTGYHREPRYQTAFLVNPDGSVKIGHETFTPEQWNLIFDLRAAQKASMEALKASFKQ